jgi:hypothetical protein
MSLKVKKVNAKAGAAFCPGNGFILDEDDLNELEAEEGDEAVNDVEEDVEDDDGDDDDFDDEDDEEGVVEPPPVKKVKMGVKLTKARRVQLFLALKHVGITLKVVYAPCKNFSIKQFEAHRKSYGKKNMFY